jgi:hypothetical protein
MNEREANHATYKIFSRAPSRYSPPLSLLSLHIDIYVCTYMYICTFIQIYIYTCLLIHIFEYFEVYITYMSTCGYIFMYTSIRTNDVTTVTQSNPFEGDGFDGVPSYSVIQETGMHQDKDIRICICVQKRIYIYMCIYFTFFTNFIVIDEKTFFSIAHINVYTFIYSELNRRYSAMKSFSCLYELS